MLRPLTEKQIDKLIDEATAAFAENGFSGAKVTSIARSAGLSVGVIYKYYKDKQALFMACVEKSLEYLDEVFSDTTQSGGSLMDMVSGLITKNQEASRLHPEYFRLYHQITVSGDSSGMEDIAGLIEGRSAELYKSMLSKGKEEGVVRDDMDPALFAFFFDNLMMMLHFAYTGSYYEERLRIYCGDEAPENDSLVHDEMMKFIAGAFGVDGK